VDAGRERLFTLSQVLNGATLREPVARHLPGEARESARPSDRVSVALEPCMDTNPLEGLRIDLYTNAVAGGWHPDELESGLGGGEEAVVLWSRALARRGANVTVYFSPSPAPAGRRMESESDKGGVRYRPQEAFNPSAARDVLVTWKDASPWLLGARAGRRIHWSSDVEAPWPAGLVQGLDAFVCLTAYHAGRLSWLPPERLHVVPHGIDTAALEAARTERNGQCALYASSPDRGLEELLRDWPRIRECLPGLELHVTYGWHRYEVCADRLPPGQQAAAREFRRRLAALLRQPGITNHGALPRAQAHRLYWRARYWLLPLSAPDAELFCLNALKARWCGATPVIHRRGGLRDTVDVWLPYDRFAENAAAPGTPLRAGNAVPVLDWDEVVRRHWIPLLTGTAAVPETGAWQP
jgi:glycosyltransferase involved in cell wall biosynthesis